MPNLLTITPALEAFLAKTGPNAPPGYDQAKDTDGWADTHQAWVVRTYLGLCDAMFHNETPPPEPVRDLTSTDELAIAVQLLDEVTRKIVKRWGFAPGAAYEWGPAWPERRLLTGGDSEPPDRVIRLPFPLVVTDDEHKQLTWVLGQLQRAIGPQDTEARPGSEVAILPDILLRNRYARELYETCKTRKEAISKFEQKYPHRSGNPTPPGTFMGYVDSAIEASKPKPRKQKRISKDN